MHLQKTNMVAKQGIFMEHQCVVTTMACKCKTFEALNLTLHGYYKHVSNVICMKTENKICLRNKECISGN